MEEAGRPLNLVELAQRLEAEGCNPGSYALGTRGSASDAFCLIHDGTAWQVFYTERGVNQEPFYTAASEADACVYFSTTSRASVTITAWDSFARNRQRLICANAWRFRALRRMKM